MKSPGLTHDRNPYVLKVVVMFLKCYQKIPCSYVECSNQFPEEEIISTMALFYFLASFTGDSEGSPTFKLSKVLLMKHVKRKTFSQICAWRKRYSDSQPWCVEPIAILYVQ
jgi:hypothetical protein